MVEKTYRVRITEDIERDLRFLGQSRVDALTSEFDMTLIKEKNNLKLYELCEKEFFTMRGVTTVNAPLGDVMTLLKMDSTAKLRDVMGEIFGTMFLDGVMLYKSKDSATRSHESLSVNWMALQSSKPHLPHRDYVFLRYGDVFEKNADNGSVYGSSGSGLYVGASIWESIELDGCAPLPASQNVVRLRLRRCGIVVEEMNHEDNLKISLFLSESHSGRATVSSLTKQWMTKMVSCVTQISDIMVSKALASQNILTKKQFVKDGITCHICVKAFSLLRRKHHCRVCGDVVCSKCSEMKNVKQGGLSKEVRVCNSCRNSTSASLRSSSSNSDSRTGRSIQGHSKTSFSAYSASSSEDPSQSFDDDTYPNSVSSSSTPPVIPENSTHNSVDVDPRLKTHPAAPNRPAPQLPRNGSRGPNDMIMLNSASTDMILLNSKAKAKDRAESANSSVSDVSYSEFGMYTQPAIEMGLSEDEMAAMELASTVRENTPFSYALSYSQRQEWPKAPLPLNETERLAKVRSLHLVDPGQHFQEMCEYAAAEMGCQISSICFIGDKSGFLMAKVGVEKREIPRNMLFDAHTIMSEEPTIILDATEDIRFANNPVVKEGQIRFYAGFPLVTTDGFIVGSLSVADEFARECLTGDKFFFLKNLAEVAIRGVEQNTLNATQRIVPAQQDPVGVGMPPPPPEMNITDAHLTMQELLRTAYTTQCQVRMQVNPVANK
ncbi:hypothetical protein PINS_up000403 [Pythium insidiosum]|nr:hypothetical protein PINS_up000403 [Pythium insidiosum]